MNGKLIVAGAVAGFCAAWAMSEFQNAWLHFAPAEPDGRPRTDQEVMRIIARHAASGLGIDLTRRQVKLLGQLLHYGFGATAGAGYAMAANRSKLVSRGFGSGFGTTFFAALDSLSPRELKPYVNDSRVVSEIYEWLTHVVYGVTLEAGRRAFTRAAGVR